jgi:TolB protein
MRFLLLFLLLPGFVAPAQPVISRLEIYDLTTHQRQTVRTDTARFEAPNWTYDGNYLLINQAGKLYKVAVTGGTKTVLNTDPATNLNNDHGLTPDGKTLILSNNDLVPGKTNGTSRVYLCPLDGSKPARLVTPASPSYWHGVSPDGRTLAYVGERTLPDKTTDYDIYTVRIDQPTQPEVRLTTTPGLDDGPEYAPDGRTVYFNSFRSGRMHLWRMNADGSRPEQLTMDAYSNWFPHPSPDGSKLIFISYLTDQGAAHPADKDVMLRLMDVKTGTIRELARFRGGQGTINVNSWSPDSKRFAFVTY